MNFNSQRLIDEEIELEKKNNIFQSQLENFRKDMNVLLEIEEMILSWESKDDFINEIDELVQKIKIFIAPFKFKFLEFSVMIQRIMNTKLKANFSNEFFDCIFYNFKNEFQFYFQGLVEKRDDKLFKINETFLCTGILYKINPFINFSKTFNTRTKKILINSKSPLFPKSPKPMLLNHGRPNECPFISESTYYFYQHHRNTNFDKQLLEIIINDDLDAFIDYIELNNIDLFKYEFDYLVLEIFDQYKNDYLYFKIDTRFENITIMDYSIYQGAINIFKFLLSQKVYFSKYYASLFSLTSANIEMMKILNNDIGIQYDEECLLWAIKNFKNDIVYYLVESNQIYCPCEMIIQSIKYTNYPILFQTLEQLKGVDDVDKYALLYYIFETMNFDMLKFILNSPSFDINTAIIKNIRFLHGLIIHIQNTPLSWAISLKDFYLVELILIDNRINLNNQIYYGEHSPNRYDWITVRQKYLYLAIQSEDIGIIELILRKESQFSLLNIAKELEVNEKHYSYNYHYILSQIEKEDLRKFFNELGLLK